MKADSAVYTIVNRSQFEARERELPYFRELFRSMKSIRFSKVEVYDGCLLGTVHVPMKSDVRRTYASFGFHLTADRLLLIEDEGKLAKWLNNEESAIRDAGTPALVLLRLVNELVERDSLFLTHMEIEIDKLEDRIIENEVDESQEILMELTAFRKKLTSLEIFYQQMEEICEIMGSEDMFSEREKDAWTRFLHHVERLQNHLYLLRENALQLRELFHSLREAEQNKKMNLITVLTSLFMPLTLITGWYGMNFVHMPELQWRFSYLGVFAVAALIVAGEIIWFKKKKIL